MGALTPLVKVAGGKARWLGHVTTYTLAGGLASAAVGATIGWLGGLLPPQRAAAPALLAAMAVAALLLARELGWLPVPLIQVARQTRPRWGAALPDAAVPALWGFDVGLTFTTYLTFSGVWLLVVVTLVVGQPAFGALLFVLYWAGRALPPWISPFLLADANATPGLLARIDRHRGLLRLVHAGGLAWSLCVLAWWAWFIGNGMPRPL